MVRWRTAQEICDLIKSEDENTGITRFFIVKLANQQKIRSIKSGRKLLIDYDSLLAYFQGVEYKYPMSQEKI